MHSHLDQIPQAPYGVLGHQRAKLYCKHDWKTSVRRSNDSKFRKNYLLPMPTVPRREMANKSFEKPPNEGKWVKVESKKGGKNSEPKKNMANPTAAPSVTNNLEVDMGFTKNFLGSKSKETKTSNSFNALVTNGPGSNLEEQHKEVEEEEEEEEEEELDDFMPPKEECYATPKLTNHQPT